MKKILSSLMIGAMLVGCGGSGGGGLPSVDNSVLTSLENQYGYFGADVQFGEYKIAQTWTLINLDETDTIHIRFYDDGEFTLDGLRSDYGVSKDGRTIRSYLLNDIKIKSVLKDFYKIQHTDGTIKSHDCYSISGGDAEIAMCPFNI